MGAGDSLPDKMKWIESNSGFIAVKEALGLAGEDKNNKLCYHAGDEMVILKKFMEMDRNGDGVVSASHVGAFTPCVISRNDGRGWFLFRFRGCSDSAQAN